MELQSINIEKETLDNENYRKVIETTSNMQLVVMSLNPKETIDAEIHKDSDQFFRVEKGECLVETFDVKNNNVLSSIILKNGDITIIEKGTCHKVTNVGNDKLKLYTIYSPPNHPPTRIDATKNDAIQDEKMEEKTNELKGGECYKHKMDKYKNKIRKITKSLL